jgi:hypothetical protein
MENNSPPRDIHQQVEYAYTTLLMHLEMLLGEVTELISDEDVSEDVKYIHGSLLKMVSKNAKLKHKLYMLNKEKP